MFLCLDCILYTAPPPLNALDRQYEIVLSDNIYTRRLKNSKFHFHSHGSFCGTRMLSMSNYQLSSVIRCPIFSVSSKHATAMATRNHFILSEISYYHSDMILGPDDRLPAALKGGDISIIYILPKRFDLSWPHAVLCDYLKLSEIFPTSSSIFR